MISTYLTLALAGFTSTAVASNAYQGMVPEVGVAVATASPEHHDERSLARRQDPGEVACASSVIDDLMPALPTDDAFTSWLVDEAADGINIQSCSVTVPASFSKVFMSYYTILDDWFETIEEDAASATDCGLEDLFITFSPLCSTSRTIFFSAANATGSDMPSTVLPTVDLPAETIWVGAAPKTGGFVRVAVGLTLFVSTALLM